MISVTAWTKRNMLRNKKTLKNLKLLEKLSKAKIGSIKQGNILPGNYEANTTTTQKWMPGMEYTP